MGLPYLQVKLYLVLRWYMNVATRRTGDVRGISLQGLCEELYIEPAPGRSESGSPSKKAVRSALAQLEKHGLIEPCGNGEVLVFLLPKASVTFAREKLKGHKRGTGSGHAIGHTETNAQQAIPREIGHAIGHTENPIKGHTSEVRVNPISVAKAAAPETQSVDNSALLLEPLQPDRIAEWVRRQERDRGYRARVISRAAQIAGWIELAVTGEELHEAYSLAKIDREVQQNHTPINLPFLDIFVRRVIDGRQASRGGSAARPALWHVTWEGLHRKATELGIPTWDREEGFVDYQRRVIAAHRAAEEEIHA